METQSCVFLGIKVKPGPIEPYKLENFPLDKTVDALKNEAEKKTNLPSSSLELIHHGKILKDDATLHESGVKNGEMIHVVKKKVPPAAPPPPSFTDADLQQLNASLRTLGCTPNAPGWTRAMQLLNDESAMSEIMAQAPSLSEDCVTLSILHEVELLAALGANIQTMRRGANAHPDLPNALRHLTRLVRARSGTANTDVPTSGFAYSLEALSDDEEPEEGDAEEGERAPITQEQLAAALQAATDAVSSSSSRGGGSGSGSGGGSGSLSAGGIGSRGGHDSLLRLMRAVGGVESSRSAGEQPAPGDNRLLITPEMFSEAISAAITRAGGSNAAGTPMEQSNAASSSQSPGGGPGAGEEDFMTQLQHMHEMGLLDDSLNVRALLICSGDVNAAINLVFSGVIGDDDSSNL